MSVTLNPGQTVSFTVSPVNAQGQPSSATLSSLSFTSSDPAVFTVSPDPANPNGGIVTALTPPVSPDAAVITATAQATEPDGVTTETVQGADTVTVITLAPVPTPASSLVFNWSVPARRR